MSSIVSFGIFPNSEVISLCPSGSPPSHPAPAVASRCNGKGILIVPSALNDAGSSTFSSG
jgi:hypothetical protein